VIIFGLLLFALGSLIAALAPNLEWIIVGRALQGSGAIAAATNALLADLTRDSERTKAMLVLGIGIGASFMLALMLGPVLEAFIGVPGIFAMTAVMALLCIPLLLIVVPAAPTPRAAHAGIGADLKVVLANPQLLRLDAGIFILHAILTGLFLALPGILQDEGGLPEGGNQFFQSFDPLVLTSFTRRRGDQQRFGRTGWRCRRWRNCTCRYVRLSRDADDCASSSGETARQNCSADQPLPEVPVWFERIRQESGVKEEQGRGPGELR
jgi:hypothetical protein